MMIKWISITALFLGLIAGIYSPVLAESPPPSIEVSIPEYQVEKVDDYDYVDIPGGDILLVDGMPRIPYYPVFVTYPEGYRIQDVLMTEVSGLETSTGLNLPVVMMEPDFPSDVELPPLKAEGWFPNEDYNWNVWINSDGSSTLVINVFPFYYNADTTNVKFYRYYRFDVEYITSDMTITVLNADKSVYKLGDEVTLDIGLKNAGQTQDVTVSIIIKQYGTNELIEGLPIRSLKDFAGEGSCTAVWNTAKTEAGDYYAEVSISDILGNILDKKTVGFGIQLSEITEKPPEIIERQPEVTEKPTEIIERPNEPSQTSTGFPVLYVIIGAILVVAIAAVLIIIKLRKKA
jgi:hypothetical protein